MMIGVQMIIYVHPFTLEALAKVETRGSLAGDGALSAGNGGGMQVAGEAAAKADRAATPGEFPVQAVKRTMANFASGLHVPPRKPAPLNIPLLWRGPIPENSTVVQPASHRIVSRPSDGPRRALSTVTRKHPKPCGED